MALERYTLYPNVMSSIPNVLDPSFQLAIAGSGTGLAFHWHADVFAETLHGERRWFLFPPHVSPEFNPRDHISAMGSPSPTLVGPFGSVSRVHTQDKTRQFMYLPIGSIRHCRWVKLFRLQPATRVRIVETDTVIEQGLSDNVRMLDAFARRRFRNCRSLC